MMMETTSQMWRMVKAWHMKEVQSLLLGKPHMKPPPMVISCRYDGPK